MRQLYSILACTLLSFATSAQVTVQTMAVTTFCPGSNLLLGYDAVGSFNIGNVFTAELSDASGSFATPTTIGTVNATSSGSITCSIPLLPAGPGYFIRVNASDSPVIGDTYGSAITIHPMPDPGMNASAMVCSVPGSIDVLTALGGTPDPGGLVLVVSGSGVVVGTVYSGVSTNGDIVQYVVENSDGCVAVSQLTATAVLAPDAGLNSTITLCSTGAPVNLFTQLGGNAQAGGAWTNPGGAQVSGLFDPAVGIPGCYTYVVAGDPPCPNDVAMVCVSVNQQVDLGMDGAMSVCGSGPAIDLGNGLPLGGTWTYLGAPHPGTFIPGVDGNGPYVYTVPGVAPCLAESVTFDLTVVAPPNAGTVGTVAWCQSFGNIDLFAQLAGTPDAGGFWTDDNATGALTGATFAAGTVPPGTYGFTYSVGVAPCTPASATVTVTVGPCLLPPDTGLPVE